LEDGFDVEPSQSSAKAVLNSPASRQRMIALKAEKRLGRKGRVWVVIGGSLERLFLNIYYRSRLYKENDTFWGFLRLFQVLYSKDHSNSMVEMLKLFSRNNISY
jgi:hypothetical protein